MYISVVPDLVGHIKELPYKHWVEEAGQERGRVRVNRPPSATQLAVKNPLLRRPGRC